MALLARLREVQRALWPYADLIAAPDEEPVLTLSAGDRAAALSAFRLRGQEARPAKGGKAVPEAPRPGPPASRPVAAASLLAAPEAPGDAPDLQANFGEGDVYRRRRQEQLRESLARRRAARDREALREAVRDRDLAQQAIERAREGDGAELQQVREREFEKAARRAQGAKVRDDPSRIRKSLRKAGARRGGQGGTATGPGGFQKRRGYLN